MTVKLSEEEVGGGGLTRSAFIDLGTGSFLEELQRDATEL